MKKLLGILFFIIGAFLFICLNSSFLYWFSGFSQFYIPPLVILFMILLFLISFLSFKKFNINKKLKYLIIIEIFSLTVGYVIIFNNVRWDITNKYAGLHALNVMYEPAENSMNVNFTGFKGVQEIYEITMDKGDIINIQYESDGLKMAILDEQYNVVKDFDVDIDYDVDFECETSGKYLMKVYGDKENGEFAIHLNPTGFVVIKDIHST